MDIKYQPGQPLRINMLATSERLQGNIVSLTRGVVQIDVDRPMPFGAPLRIDFDDCMILGEVCRCEASPTGHLITLEVNSAIPVLSDLARLVSAVMSDGRAADVEKMAPVRIAAA